MTGPFFIEPAGGVPFAIAIRNRRSLLTGGNTGGVEHRDGSAASTSDLCSRRMGSYPAPGGNLQIGP